MEFQPKPEQNKTEEELVKQMYQGVKTPEGYTPKTQEERQAVWDAKKAQESEKFNPENVTQTEMFDGQEDKG